MKAASFAPLYCALYPELCEYFRAHGYALAIHGSLSRDFGLIAVPWVDNPSDPAAVIDSITKQFALEPIGPLTEKPHGRRVQTMRISYGQCFLDLSFMPALLQEKEKPEPKGYCSEGDRCVCGGDVPAVRTGCFNWKSSQSSDKGE